MEDFCITNAINKELISEIIDQFENVINQFWYNIRKSNIFLFLFLFLGFIIFLAIGLILGKVFTYYIIIIVLAAYFIIGIILVLYVKSYCTHQLVLAHISLSIAVKYVNDNYAKSKHLFVRPGGLARWIEFIPQKQQHQRSETLIKLDIIRGT